MTDNEIAEKAAKSLMNDDGVWEHNRYTPQEMNACAVMHILSAITAAKREKAEQSPQCRCGFRAYLHKCPNGVDYFTPDLGEKEADVSADDASKQEGTEERVVARIRARRDAGRAKYGKTMEREDLTILDWLRHAQDEATDLAIYLERVFSDVTAATEWSGPDYGTSVPSASPASGAPEVSAESEVLSPNNSVSAKTGEGEK